jgi:single-stranded-DNA-specific exonuclease
MELDRGNGSKIKAIAWRWGEYCPVPERVDLAYKLRANHWQDTTSVELELVGIRLPETEHHAVRANNWEPILEYKQAPSIKHLPQWHRHDPKGQDLPQPVLLYGYDRPNRGFLGDVDRDRPSRNYKSLILWSLPPSLTHLRWLIALAKPESIYLGGGIPTLPTAEDLRDRVSALVDSKHLNLLALGQEWWVAPCTIVAALRDLGYDCNSFAPTQTLDLELGRLKRWYSYPIEKLPQLL